MKHAVHRGCNLVTTKRQRARCCTRPHIMQRRLNAFELLHATPPCKRMANKCILIRGHSTCRLDESNKLQRRQLLLYSNHSNNTIIHVCNADASTFLAAVAHQRSSLRLCTGFLSIRSSGKMTGESDNSYCHTVTIITSLYDLV